MAKLDEATAAEVQAVIDNLEADQANQALWPHWTRDEFGEPAVLHMATGMPEDDLLDAPQEPEPDDGTIRIRKLRGVTYKPKAGTVQGAPDEPSDPDGSPEPERPSPDPHNWSRARRQDDGQIGHVYDYRDEEGRLLYKVIRSYDSDGQKEFRQQRPDSAKGTEGRKLMAGVRRVLYRLPEVLTAIQAGEPVYVTEGEKDADAMAAVGCFACCNPMGADMWEESYSRSLAGADVVVVAHRDVAGRRHAGKVVQSLRGLAHSVRLVESAAGNDAYDHLEAGLSVADFVEEPLQPQLPDEPQLPQSSDRFEEFKSRIRNATEASDGQWVGLCPAHDDRNPSLSFARGDRQDLVIKCFAGCSYEQVLAAVGMSAGGQGKREPAPASSTADEALALPDGLRPTDVGNASRLVRLTKDRIRYVHAWGKWLVYHGGVWDLDQGHVLVRELAKRVPRDLFRLAAVNTNPEMRKSIWNHAMRSESNARIVAACDLARGDEAVLIEHEQLDQDPWVLNVINGTIELRSGQLRPHDPADLLTMRCAVAYEPDAEAPLWEECLRRWQPDPEIRRYLQVRAGASATGVPTETFDIDFGDGANGKTRFHEAIRSVLGPYSVVPDKSLFVVQRHESHPTHRADLFRKRLAVAGEVERRDSLAESMVKNLTGTDRINARRMREDPWEFDPTHTFIVFSNYRPQISGQDTGIWRRLRLVPWEVTIPEEERDPNLGERLRAEAAGILAWVVEGARIFAAEGFNAPESVKAQTQEYRTEENVCGRFVDEVLRIGEGRCFAASIHGELMRWCAERGVDEPSRNELADELKRHGCWSKEQKVRGRRGIVWYGVAIADPEEASDGTQQRAF